MYKRRIEHTTHMAADGTSEIFEWDTALHSMEKYNNYKKWKLGRMSYDEYTPHSAMLEQLYLEGHALRASIDAENVHKEYLLTIVLPASYESIHDMHTRMKEHVHTAAAETGAQGEKALRLRLSKLGMAQIKRQSDPHAIRKEIQAIEAKEMIQLAEMQRICECCDRIRHKMRVFRSRSAQGHVMVYDVAPETWHKRGHWYSQSTKENRAADSQDETRHEQWENDMGLHEARFRLRCRRRYNPDLDYDSDPDYLEETYGDEWGR